MAKDGIHNLQLRVAIADWETIKQSAAKVSMQPNEYTHQRLMEIVEATEDIKKPQRPVKYYRLLDYIIQHGTAKDKEWILGNLENFCQAIHSRGGPPYKASGQTV